MLHVVVFTKPRWILKPPNALDVSSTQPMRRGVSLTRPPRNRCEALLPTHNLDASLRQVLGDQFTLQLAARMAEESTVEVVPSHPRIGSG